MKKTYVTFTREMARAYREGRKRMTRRVVKWPKWIQDYKYSVFGISEIAEIINSNEYRGVVKRGYFDGLEYQYKCPYGCPGDQIILGTTWAVPKECDHLKPTELPIGYFSGLPIMSSVSGAAFKPIPIWSYFDGDDKPVGFGKLRPARFLPGFLRDRMPQETLKVVRAERLQSITEEDAIAEGIFETPREPGFDCWSTHGIRDYYPTPRNAFIKLWDSINGKRPGCSWSNNPYVWVLGW